MKFNTDKLTLGNNNGVQGVFIQIPLNLLDKLKKIIDKEGLKTVEIKKLSKKKSVSANNYAWQLINKIAIKLGSTDIEIYSDLIKKYGVKEYVEVIIEAIPILKKSYKFIEVINRTTINGKPAVNLRLIRGLSTYDVQECSDFIKGIVEDAKILDIETMTPREIKTMMEGYKK